MSRLEQIRQRVDEVQLGDPSLRVEFVKASDLRLLLAVAEAVQATFAEWERDGLFPEDVNFGPLRKALAALA